MSENYPYPRVWQVEEVLHVDNADNYLRYASKCLHTSVELGGEVQAMENPKSST